MPSIDDPGAAGLLLSMDDMGLADSRHLKRRRHQDGSDGQIVKKSQAETE
jgi:hypothetical protein